ncbi:GGDEF domain-containing protein [Methylophilus sp.]|jgi:diguanylate cyclase|uniref:GGDEF domain-containing protein n=1 Tax=Methylophilus sp. TaxID=29541 RepID=UPI0025CD6F1F|nr:GGDEF domain-containing protein [Methylophilus sp.]
MTYDEHTPETDNPPEYAHILVTDEWQAIITSTPPAVIQQVYALIGDHMQELLTGYRHYLSTDPVLSKVLNTEEMRTQWTAVFEEWAYQLFSMQFSDVSHFVQAQHALGMKLSRVGYPAHSVSKSLRMINACILRHILMQPWTDEQKLQSVMYVNQLIGLSYEIRNQGYMQSISDQTRLDESYRLAVIGSNIAMERERQRAFLTEWERNILAWFYSPSDIGLPRLAKSEFGMWFLHKASLMFERTPKLQNIAECIAKIDQQILPKLETTQYDDRAAIGSQFQLIQQDLVKIKFVINEIFDAHIELDNARDSLTRLLNRRFIHTVLSREIALQKRAGAIGFAVLILDLDHFKSVNDRHGHAAGDMALQKVAALMTESVRPSDFVFRYGGEEMLLILVEADAATATKVAEEIRHKVAQAQILAPNGERLALTVSIGGALAKGNIDYESVIAEADKALYQAKHAGRNRVMMRA